MGIQNPTLTAVALKAISGRLQSGYPSLHPDKNWQIASPYRLSSVQDMIAISPRAIDSDPMAYYKWADPNGQYYCKLSWFGGEPPYRITLFQAPTGATVGGTSTVQTWNRSQDTDIPTLYHHTLPSNEALVMWQPTLGDVGVQQEFSALVESQDGQIIIFGWSAITDSSKSKWFDSVNGNDANAGTFASPLQTSTYGFNTLPNAKNYIFRFKDGNYPAGFTFNTAGVKSIIGHGNNVVLNTTNGGLGGATDDITLMNLKIDGSPPTGHFKPIGFNGRINRLVLHNLHFSNIVSELSGENEACIFTVGIGAPSSVTSDYLSFSDITMDNTVKVQMICTYSARYVSVNNCGCWDIDSPNGKLLHFKDQTSYISVRYCYGKGITNNSLVYFGNQYPINANYQELLFSRFDYTGNTAFNAISWNGQGTTAPFKGTEMYSQRNSVRAGTTYTYNSVSNGVGGEKLNISSNMWSSTLTPIYSNASGAQEIGESSVRINDDQWDINMDMVTALKASNLGVRGAQIASTLVT